MGVHWSVEDGVFLITINRPVERNAIDRPSAELLDHAFQCFETNSAKVAVLTGAGGNFCSGADLKAFAAGTPNRMLWGGTAPLGPSRRQPSKPVIAAIEGYAVAGGLELALLADLRVMAEDATVGVFCRRFGVPLIDGGTVRLPRLIGHGRAMDLILTGRPVAIDEALAIGLVSRRAPSGEALSVALALAKQISSFPQQALLADRQSVFEQWGMEFGAALQSEFKRGLSVVKTGETLEGAKRFAEGEGRAGRFKE